MVRIMMGIKLMIATVISINLFIYIDNIQCSSEDEIVWLPGLTQNLPFKQYSGYLNGSDGTSRLFYWLVESQRSPQNDPLLLWLNGGPGCSSLSGLTAENGPIFIRDDMTVGIRPAIHAWNGFANILYLESPAGVGYSYSSNTYKATLNDDATADNNFAAIKHFFTKFPQYSNRPFFITGESYAGVYIPTLAQRVVGDSSINLIGLAIGNGILDYNINSKTIISYANYHGILGPTLWANLQQACCSGPHCQYTAPYPPNCHSHVSKALQKIYSGGLNAYNYYDLCRQYSIGQIRQHAAFTTLTKHAQVTYGSPPCYNLSATIRYFQRQDVKKALHVSDQAGAWTVCNNTVLRTYNVMYKSAIQLIPPLLSKCRVLLYYGDLDMVCNFLGGEESLYSTGLPTFGNYEPWYYNDSNGRQVGGFASVHPNLKFITIKGAGHLVPGDRPDEAWSMMKTFIEQPFIPPPFFNGNIGALIAVILVSLIGLVVEYFF